MSRVLLRISAAATLAVALILGAFAVPAQAATGNQHITMTLKLDTMTKHEMSGGSTYGTMQLAGKGTWNGKPVRVLWNGAFTYVDGEGPWTAQTTIIFKDGSRAGIRSSLRTSTDGAGAVFVGTSRFLGGTGTLAGIAGKGKVSGGRSGELGTPITITFDMSSSVGPR